MSWLNRRTFMLMPLALGACGFTPAYKEGGAAEGLLGRVRAKDPTDKAGFAYVQRLEERLGLPTAPLYSLDYALTQNVIAGGVTASNQTTRYSRVGSVTFTLTETATGRVVAKGRVEGSASYGATGSTVALLAAEEDAHMRLMRMLADRTVTRLLALLGSGAA